MSDAQESVSSPVAEQFMSLDDMWNEAAGEIQAIDPSKLFLFPETAADRLGCLKFGFSCVRVLESYRLRLHPPYLFSRCF